MTFEEVVAALGLTEVDETFMQGWEESEKSFPGVGLPFFDEAFIAENGRLVGLDAAAIDTMAGAAKRARREPALAHLLWHEHRLFCGIGDAPIGPRRNRLLPHSIPLIDRPRTWVRLLGDEHDPAGFPELVAAAIEGAPALNLLVALSGVPGARSFYERRRISPTILRDTLSDFAVWVRHYREHFGYTGITVGTLSWLRRHLRGRLFRLGRLQFMHGSFTRDVTVYRSASTGTLRALAAGGLTVDGSGLLLFDPGEAPTVGEVWTTRKSVDEDALYGNPIDPDGIILDEEVRLPLDEWAAVLHERSPVLEIHIPRGGPLSLQECASSVGLAPRFFGEHFPERTFAGFSCESWFLGRELLDLLPAGSNMRSFAETLYLYPCLGDSSDAVRRLFGPFAPETAPKLWERETSLQRAVFGHLTEGGRLRPGGGFLPAGDLPLRRRSYRDS